ncbi:response regulator [Halomonas sp. 7T]|uniref:response regulator n=1 Tax=Halomonas sp. 7T TaxID=2893469 RepID=UPI0021DA47F7|nr:response regulator [Halomonas sp. 7T]UXZ53006.1 response regulator [Halomonas sp. 7T]
MQPNQREHFWNAVIWPILWPLLLVQSALVTLCVLVGFVIWGISPNQTSWSTTLWLTLALLLGSCMNVAAFLMLLKHRAKRSDVLLRHELKTLERNAKRLSQTVAKVPVEEQRIASADAESLLPLQRLVQVNEALAEWLNIRQQAPLIAPLSEQPKQDQALLEDLHHQQKQLKHLMAGRDRAREESRLKSGYLTLLQREADNLFAYLGELIQKDRCKTCHHDISHVQDRLADIRALLANFAQENASDEESNEVLPSTAKRQLKVLVVDDGPVNLMLARQMLEAQGLYVEGVSSGEQALERQQTTFYDLVFMDIFMPTLDGFETAQRWRSYERSNDSPRSVLVALTANVDNARRDTCEAAGLDDVLAKPYQPDTLVGMITKWVPSKNHETPT